MQTAAQRALFKKLSASKHLLFLPSLIALLVKKSGAISASHIASRKAFNALAAVCGTLSRVVDVDPGRINPEVRHQFLLHAKLNRNADNAAKDVSGAISQEMYRATSNLLLSTFLKRFSNSKRNVRAVKRKLPSTHFSSALSPKSPFKA